MFFNVFVLYYKPASHIISAGHSHPGCGATPSVHKWMEGIQTNAVKEDEFVPPSKEEPKPEPLPQAQPRVQVRDKAETPGFKYSAEANDEETPRFRRALENPNKRRSCSLYIQTDPLFWNHVREVVRK